MKPERRYEFLYGKELQALVAEKPIAWVPLGPLERHGEHLPWGLDGFLAHGHCLRLAERFGGVVLPPVHVAGIHDPWHPDPEVERQMQAEVGDFYLRPSTLVALAEDVTAGLVNVGFRLVVLYTGHYPAVQGKLLKETAAKLEPRLKAKVIAFDAEDALTEPLDHAGRVETSLFLALGGEARLGALRPEQADRIGFWRTATPPSEASRARGLAALDLADAWFARRLRELGLA